VDHRHRDGHTFRLAVTANRITVGNQALVLAVHRDISDRIRAEAERERLAAKLAQVQKMESVGRLAGGVAHDFNNLLTVINGFSSLALKDLREGDPLREVLIEINRSGERAAALTKQLLAFSRKQILQPRAFSLNEVISGIHSMLRRLIGEDIDLTISLSGDRPWVYADPHQIEQVLMNLAVNARDAMSTGGRLRIETGHEQTDLNRFAVLSVTDTGSGMDEETLRCIFEPFFTTKASGQGTGLGLSMVQGIVEQSGGRIAVESRLGQGTTFRVYLPLWVAGPSQPVRPAPLEDLNGRQTVMVVEDQVEVRNYAAKVLQLHGYQVVVAANAGEALLAVEDSTGQLDLLLTDVIMPRMSGRELAERMTALRPDLRVLFMSGYTDDVVVGHGVQEHTSRFVQKPFTPEELLRAVQEALGRTPASR